MRSNPLNTVRLFAGRFLLEHIYVAALLIRQPMRAGHSLDSCHSYADPQSVSHNSESPRLLSFKVKGGFSSLCAASSMHPSDGGKSGMKTEGLSA